MSRFFQTAVRSVLFVALSATLFVGALHADDKDPQQPKPVESPMIGHMVYFKLKDGTPEARKKLVDACKKYLVKHEGIVFFTAGELSDSVKGDLNDRDWDVALHMVFLNKAAHDKYQDHADHLRFIDENKESWSKVRVFDSEFKGYLGLGMKGIEPKAIAK